MKRSFTFLMAAFALLTFLAVPLGMWGQSIEINTSNFTKPNSGSGYAAYDGTRTIGGVDIASSNVMVQSGNLQFKKSSGYLYNSTAMPGNITKITMATATNFTIYVSTTANAETQSVTSGSAISGNYTYFKVKCGSSTGSTASITIEYSIGGTGPYTVTYNSNGGTGTMTDSNSPYTAGATVTVLGNEFTRTDYEFDHWNTAADDSGTSYDEDDTFTINANTTLYAQWTESTTPTPDGITATLNIEAYADANNWTNGTKYQTAIVFPVSFVANGDGNTGKYYSSGQDWRFYQGEGASITISVPEGYTLVSVKPTYSVSNGGVLKNGNATIETGTTVNVSGTSVTFTVGNSGSATNGQVRFTNIDVVYVSDGGTPASSNEYVLYTGELVEGDYLIVYDGYAMNTTVDSDRLQYEEVTATSNVIYTDNAEIVWHIAKSGQYWTIYNADANAYAASTGAKNKAQMLADGTDAKALWTVSGTETYEFVNKQNTTNNVNANLRNNGTYGFACYATSTGGALSLYKKVEPATETYTLEIAGYGNNTSNGNWYLIASPLAGETDPEDVTNLINNNTGQGYDLYYFDQTQELEWINYKPGQGSTDPGFSLVPGKGYLYANSGDANNTPNIVRLTFTGTPYSGNGQVTLRCTGNNNDMKGWNLVGNPFDVTTYVTEDYLVMNDEGTALILSDREDNYVNRMEGIFVYTETDNKTMTFSKNPVSKSARLALNITKGRGVIDRAIVRFGNHQSLPKFQFREGSTKVYIPMDGKDYALVSAEGEGEKPVNFKAEENGRYTITVQPEEVEFNYLHLIDNMTGADIDLLQTPSYSFEARTTDYASRFRLVFSATGIEENNANEAFAYCNGDEWMISNEGEANLQVVDLTGRILSSETINGTVAKAITAAPGIYMLRLVSDNEVKTQKILVK